MHTHTTLCLHNTPRSWIKSALPPGNADIHTSHSSDFAGGRLNVWEKFVGLRWSLVEVKPPTAIGVKIQCVYFFQIGIFIAQSRFISPSECPKHTPVYAMQNAQNHAKFTIRGVVTRYTHSTFPRTLLVVGPARESAQCFGKSWSASDAVWWR